MWHPPPVSPLCAELGLRPARSCQPWQTPALGYDPLHVDVGAPMDVGAEYRWNLPVITYGFSSSFLDYFGQAGVAAIDNAFAILNALPSADEINIAEYSIDPRRVNFPAQAINLFDLKSTTLSFLFKHLGLAAPETWTWTLRSVSVDGQPVSPVTNYSVIHRNFDPITFAPSDSVNATRYYYDAFHWPWLGIADAYEYPVDPTTASQPSRATRTQLREPSEPQRTPTAHTTNPPRPSTQLTSSSEKTCEKYSLRTNPATRPNSATTKPLNHRHPCPLPHPNGPPSSPSPLRSPLPKRPLPKPVHGPHAPLSPFHPRTQTSSPSPRRSIPSSPAISGPTQPANPRASLHPLIPRDNIIVPFIPQSPPPLPLAA